MAYAAACAFPPWTFPVSENFKDKSITMGCRGGMSILDYTGADEDPTAAVMALFKSDPSRAPLMYPLSQVGCIQNRQRLWDPPLDDRYFSQPELKVMNEVDYCEGIYKNAIPRDLLRGLIKSAHAVENKNMRFDGHRGNVLHSYRSSKFSTGQHDGSISHDILLSTSGLVGNSISALHIAPGSEGAGPRILTQEQMVCTFKTPVLQITSSDVPCDVNRSGLVAVRTFGYITILSPSLNHPISQARAVDDNASETELPIFALKPLHSFLMPSEPYDVSFGPVFPFECVAVSLDGVVSSIDIATGVVAKLNKLTLDDENDSYLWRKIRHSLPFTPFIGCESGIYSIDTRQPPSAPPRAIYSVGSSTNAPSSPSSSVSSIASGTDYKRITSFATAANPNHISVSSTDRTVLIDLRMISRPMLSWDYGDPSEPPCHSEVLSLGTDMDAIMTWNRNQGDIVLYPYTSKPTQDFSISPLTVLASLQDPTSSLKSFPSASSPFLKTPSAPICLAPPQRLMPFRRHEMYSTPCPLGLIDVRRPVSYIPFVKYMNVGKITLGRKVRSEAEKDRVENMWPPLDGVSWMTIERKRMEDGVRDRSFVVFQASAESSVFCQEYGFASQEKNVDTSRTREDGAADMNLEEIGTVAHGQTFKTASLSFEDKGVLLADSEFGLPKEILDDIYSARNIMRPMDVHDFQPVIQHLKRTISNFGKPAPSSRKGKDEAVIPIDKKRHDAIEHLKASHHPTLFDLYIASTPRTIKYTKNRPKLPHIRPDSWLFEGSEMAQIIAAVETVQNESYSTQNILDGLDSQVDATHHASPEKYLWKCRPDVPQGGESSQERTGWGEAEELHDLRRYIDEILPRPQAIAEDGNSHNVRSIRDIALDWIARDLQLASAVLRSKTTEEEIEQVSATELGHRSMKKLKRRQMPSQSSSVVGSDYGDRSYDSDAESSFMSSYSQAASSIGDDESFDDLESLATSSSWGGDSSIATSEAATDGEYLTEDEMRMSSEDEDDEVMADFDDAASQASQRSFTGMSLPLWVPRMSITHALRPNKPIQLSSRAARLRDRWLNPNAYYRSIKRRATSASGGSQTHTRQSSQNWQDGEEEWDGSVSQIDAAAALKFRTLNEELEREQELSLRVSSGRLSVGASKGSSQRQSLPQDRRISMPARLVGSGTSRRETLVATSQPMENAISSSSSFPEGSFSAFASQPASSTKSIGRVKKKRRAGF